MRLVGPRPEDPRFLVFYRQEDLLVLSVPPGITGPSQLTFFNEEDILASDDDPETTYVRDVLPRKLAIDAHYASDHHLVGDLRILVRTALTALHRPG